VFWEERGGEGGLGGVVGVDGRLKSFLVRWGGWG